MLLQESETAELKQQVIDDIKKEVIAFANTTGGTLYIGVSDDGTVVGVSQPDQVIQQISNMMRDSIKPDITMFLHYETKSMDGKSVVAVEIQRGTERPYYLAKKGLRPEGVYVRQGTSSVPASDSAIRQMIKETDGDSFEEMRSLDQELSFEAAQNEFEKRKIAFGPTQMKTLGILNSDDIYTNLGLLLSDQCVHTLKAAVFAGTDQNEFQDRQEFSGSLLQQMNQAYAYIDQRNRLGSTFDKLLRIDHRDYPEVAIRESLLNSLVHRDYSFRASTLISIYQDRIEFTSIGGLPVGVSLDDVMLGLSVCRNSKLANVFYRLKLIEAYGTGMKKIMGAYLDCPRQPEITVTDHAFKIVLPNQNELTSVLKTQSTAPEDRQEQQVLAFVHKNGTLTRKQVEALLDLNQTAAARLVKRMEEHQLLLRKGKGKNTKYIAAE